LSFLQNNGIDVRLVFLYFTGNKDMKGPESAANWLPYINSAHAHLDLTQYPEDVVTIYQDVGTLG